MKRVCSLSASIVVGLRALFYSIHDIVMFIFFVNNNDKISLSLSLSLPLPMFSFYATFF